MQKREEIRDQHGVLIGRYETKQHPERVELRDRSGRLLGHYNAEKNETRDAHGIVVGRGNIVATLLRT